MTLQLFPSEFPYIWGNLVFFFISVHRLDILHTVQCITVHFLIILAPRLESPGVQWEHSRGRGRWLDQLTEVGCRPRTGRRARSRTLQSEQYVIYGLCLIRRCDRHWYQAGKSISTERCTGRRAGPHWLRPWQCRTFNSQNLMGFKLRLIDICKKITSSLHRALTSGSKRDVGQGLAVPSSPPCTEL